MKIDLKDLLNHEVVVLVWWEVNWDLQNDGRQISSDRGVCYKCPSDPQLYFHCELATYI